MVLAPGRAPKREVRKSASHTPYLDPKPVLRSKRPWRDAEHLGADAVFSNDSALIKRAKRDSEVKLLRSDSELHAADAVVVVMGPTGAGKSRFIREATGEDVEVGHSFQSSEQTRKSFSIAKSLLSNYSHQKTQTISSTAQFSSDSSC